jgi:hypothetical protein
MATRDISDRQVCAAYEIAAKLRQRPDVKEYVWPYDLLMQWTGQPYKVCYRAMERAWRRDFVDYGVSLRAGYLMPKGRALLDGEP